MSLSIKAGDISGYCYFLLSGKLKNLHGRLSDGQQHTKIISQVRQYKEAEFF